jgi:hypothetical protein
VRYQENDRLRVARVRVEGSGDSQEIEACWVSISPPRKTVGIWLAPDEPDPILNVPLADAIIDWAEPEPPAA